eukprot:785064-Ditylum_brightwellii.AAC.1
MIDTGAVKFMSGNNNFFFNLKPLSSTTHHTVATVDDDTNLPLVGIGTMGFKFGCYVIAINNSLFVPSLANKFFSALDFGVQQERSFTIQSGSSWLEFSQFQVSCIIGTEDITVFGSPPSDKEILTPEFTYIASYNIPASNANPIHLPPTPLPYLHV